MFFPFKIFAASTDLEVHSIRLESCKPSDPMRHCRYPSYIYFENVSFCSSPSFWSGYDSLVTSFYPHKVVERLILTNEFSALENFQLNKFHADICNHGMMCKQYPAQKTPGCHDL